ncbi:hypothetical protein HYX05_01075 [Candidatus Woesearchaeota archaeon]|nr:hypothetical protein [Candidatus Woesearchaeota archaeon]
MTSQQVFNFIGNLEELFFIKGLGRGNSPLETLMTKVKDMFDLGKGDIKRYGGMQPSTRQAIGDSIKTMAKNGYFAEARTCALDYKQLEKEEEQAAEAIV